MFDWNNLPPEGEELFAVVRSAVMVTYERNGGHSYSCFVPKCAAESYEKNLRETSPPTTLQDYVIQQYADDLKKIYGPRI